MKKIIISVLALSTLIGGVIAQNNPNPEIKPCGTTEYQEELFRKHPQYRQLFEQIEKQQNEFVKEFEKIDAKSSGVVYRIPIVFHILHAGGPENISDAQVFDCVEIMNRDYRKLNADVNNVNPAFAGITADVEVEFVLATKAPDGTCFNGITRTFSALTFDGSSGSAQVTAIRNGNDVYQGQWPGNRYLNVFVVADAGGAAGYTTKPNLNTQMTNGIWVLHNYTGSIGTASPFTSRTMTHEAGHWLNLDHTWGGSNNPGVATNCNIDDGVADTPNTIGWTTCNTNGNTCSSLDNVENYMEYSYCSKMFTQGQRTRMRAALNSSTGGRNNVWTTANLNLVGANGNLEACKARFEADRYVICEGESVTFNDLSYHNIIGWNWSFTGGSPTTSTAQNPTITYSAPGSYAVTLQVSDGTNSVSETKTAYITVLPANGRSAPFFEGFENITTFPTPEWYTVGPYGQAFQVTANAAASGSKSLYLNNANGVSGDIDEFYSSTINLSNAASVTLSFKYAFAKKQTANTDNLQVWASSDCGQTWQLRRNISSNQIATAPNTTGSFVPTAAQWETVTITNILSSFFTPNFQFKILFKSGGGNNLYIDDINLDVAVGVEEHNQFVSGLSVFPNPTSDAATVRFNLSSNSNVNVSLLDMLGREVINITNGNLSAGEQQFIVNRNGLTRGVYMIRVQAEGEQSVQRIVFE
ncbi:MAG: M43 family zinc metalloprotease [Flavobacteriales bacterium]